MLDQDIRYRAYTLLSKLSHVGLQGRWAREGIEMGFESLWMFDWLGTVLPVFFAVVLGIVVLSIVREALSWNRNRQQPVLTVNSKIAARRTHLKQVHHEPEAPHTITVYYVTFEVESGDRLEFQLSGEDYGMCAEGDEGELTFRGTKFYSFERRHRTMNGSMGGHSSGSTAG